MSRPRFAAEEDSLVTVAARGYSPPTPKPSKNLFVYIVCNLRCVRTCRRGNKSEWKPKRHNLTLQVEKQ